MKILDVITDEVHNYLNGDVEISDGIRFSEYKLKKRIMFFKNKHYPTGKITESGDYEYWFDLIHPAVNNEIKNLDFDSKHVMVFSKNPVADFAAVFTANLGLQEFMWEEGIAQDLNATVEDFSADGNVLFRKTKNGYEKWDMLNTFLTNPTARTVNDTDIIERFYMSQMELREMESSGVYSNVDEVIQHCGNKFFSKTEKGVVQTKSSLTYELFRRTGHMSERDLFEAQGKEGGDSNKYVLARVVVAGIRKGKKDQRYVLYADDLKGNMSDWFKEAHRGPYKGKWFREGLYELLFDHQVRYNEISNQIARGLEWASKVLFSHNDITTIQNVRVALENGDLIKSESVRQIEVRMQGFDQLVADRNAVIQQANEISNAFEIVQGKNLPSQTAFRTAATMDINATKLYVFLRQKLAVCYKEVFADFVLKNHIAKMKTKDILRVTGDSQFIDKFRQMAVNGWYCKNLAKIGPHSPEMRQEIFRLKLEQYQADDIMIENIKEIWKDVMPRLRITITGENYLVEEIQTISEMLQYEADPVRRAYLLDTVYAAKGIPVPPAVQQQVEQQQPQRGGRNTESSVPQREQEPVAA